MGRPYHTTFVWGGEAGAMVQVSRQHWAVQVATLYAQKGFRVDDEHEYDPNVGGVYMRTRETYRLNYVTLPLQLAYTLHADGQGFQGFLGGYVGFLLNGQLTYDDIYRRPSYEPVYYKGKADIKPGQELEMKGDVISKGTDAGVQAGIGYRYQQLLTQISYSHGLVNLGTKYPNQPSNLYTPEYSNRVIQVSFTYLFAPLSGRPK
ncbi:hypothetical protein PK28_17150 (plasmid) [Hymenobacter sp. DG25B]|nr:hypothetical protein PK28_17150 [Hymenobacter sp. DG25B]